MNVMNVNLNALVSPRPAAGLMQDVPVDGVASPPEGLSAQTDAYACTAAPAPGYVLGAPYRLEAVRPGDAAALAAIDCSAFTAPWPIERFDTLLAKPSVEGLLASTALGTLGYFLIDHGSERGGADYLSSIGVVSAAQGKKVGERLFLEAVKQSRDSGAPACWLHVDVTNHGAMRLYEKYGFQVAGFLPNNYPEDGHDGYEMVLSDLQSPAVGEKLVGLETKLEAAIRASCPMPAEHHHVAAQ